MSQDTRKQEEARSHLMGFAMKWFAEWSAVGADALPAELPTDSDEWLAEYRELLGSGSGPEAGTPLLSIFSRIKPEEGPDPPPAYWPATPLSLQAVAHPTDQDQARAQSEPDLWHRFLEEWKPTEKWEPEGRFEAFAHLLHKWAWAVPCSCGEPGVSLYEEFRALSALVHASNCEQTPAKSFLLVGGDIPGIQDFVYTITSKGAAKGLRGRSFFIQLLGDAVVRRLLADLELPETNIIYAAGGSFMLLAPPGAEDAVSALGKELDKGMLREFEGDMAFCLACEPLAAREVSSAAFSNRASRALVEAIARQKRRRFAKLAEKEWTRVFGSQGYGRDFCSVCQHEQQPGERGETLEGGGWKCDQCASFEELAQTVAQERLLLYVGEGPPADESSRWQKLLADLTGWSYVFGTGTRSGLDSSAMAYAVNDIDFLAQEARGFRLIANTTPREKGGQVRTFEGLADGARGIKRVGVLRMDVDDLGRALTQWLSERTMASASAISQTLDRFFTGWLDAICQEVMAEPGMKGVNPGPGDLLYVIYAGGDDLFVVGSWHLMPLLAERIAQHFTRYTGGNPHLHISAGITLEDRKFPLYQAARRAGEALDGSAKELVRRVKEAGPQENEREVRKNAISFLGQAVGWEAYPTVKGTAEQLIELLQDHGVARSLLGTMRAIHSRYYENVRQARKRGLQGAKVYYGPWMWRKVYQLSRTKRGKAPAAEKAITKLEEEVLVREKMPYVQLGTRWAEYLTRGGGDHE